MKGIKKIQYSGYISGRFILETKMHTDSMKHYESHYGHHLHGLLSVVPSTYLGSLLATQ